MWLGFALLGGAYLAVSGLWLGLGKIIGSLWPQAGFSIGRSYSLMLSLTSRSGQIFWFVVATVSFVFAAFWCYDAKPGRQYGYARHSDADDQVLADKIAIFKRGEMFNKIFAVGAAAAAVALVVIASTLDAKLTPRAITPSITIEYASQKKQPLILERINGSHDPQVKTDVTPIEYLEKGFDQRPASLVGAQKVMAERATGDSRADVLDATYAYLPAEDGTGRWTTIRDGSGRRIHIDSIVEWNGEAEKIHQCRFEGENELNYALTGEYSNSLADQVRREIPNVYWALSDTYGYCAKGNVPTIVLPVKLDQWFNGRSVEVPAGVVVVRGSQSGEPQIEYKRSVKIGELEGPVYPISIAAQQREMINWGAGRKWQANGFGFDPVNLGANKGNSSEYVLRSALDERVYYATPLTPRESRAETIMALSLVESGSVTYGEFNTLRVQVHHEEDEKLMTEQDLERRARDVLARIDPSFLNKGQEGELQEFIPSADGNWTAFAVRSGQPRYLLTIRPGQLDQAVELNGGEMGRVLYDGTASSGGSGSNPTGGESTGGDELAGLSDAELQARLDAAIDELARLNAEDRSRRVAAGS
jgi:uncharacterized small protein (DUF1192 family)